MSARINNGILPGYDELIRDRIGEILALEIPNQATLLNKQELNASVWVERFIPFDQTDLPAINIELAQENFRGQTVIQTNGVYQYHIDVHVNAKSTTDVKGDKAATLKMQRLLGICRAILEDPQYIRLGFEAPSIFYRHATGKQFRQPDTTDSTYTAMGRLTLEVKAAESMPLVTSPWYAGSNTSVTLNETTDGYVYVSTLAIASTLSIGNNLLTINQNTINPWQP